MKLCQICGVVQPCPVHGRTPVSDEDFEELTRDVIADLAAIDSPAVDAVGKPAAPDPEQALITRISMTNAAVRYIIEGHDETLAFSTSHDAAKFWEFLRRLQRLTEPAAECRSLREQLEAVLKYADDADCWATIY
jgi:hypothetical protein